ncbi:MAG: hypothetical protein WC953_11435, partial [Pseudomonas sp.]
QKLVFDGRAETDGDFDITGGAGNDIITGGTGDDVLTGGDGADTFVFQGGIDDLDTITDFTAGVGGDVFQFNFWKAAFILDGADSYQLGGADEAQVLVGKGVYVVWGAVDGELTSADFGGGAGQFSNPAAETDFLFILGDSAGASKDVKIYHIDSRQDGNNGAIADGDIKLIGIFDLADETTLADVVADNIG